jgi:protein involved in polysaccharide export with SLBB domain
MIKKRLVKPVSLILVNLILQIQLTTVANGAAIPDNSVGQLKSSTTISTPPGNDTTKPFIAGDAILIDTFPDTSLFLNKSLAIDDQGMVQFPIIGKIKITDMSTTELEEFLKSQYKMYLRTSTLKVIPLIRICILGGFVRPGLYYVESNNSLWEVVQLAGGTMLATGLKEMVWERNRDEIRDDLVPFVQAGTSLKRIGFRSGDQLYTPNTLPLRFDDYLTRYLPVISLAITSWIFYLTYQQQVYLMQQTRR